MLLEIVLLFEAAADAAGFRLLLLLLLSSWRESISADAASRGSAGPDVGSMGMLPLASIPSRSLPPRACLRLVVVVAGLS